MSAGSSPAIPTESASFFGMMASKVLPSSSVEHPTDKIVAANNPHASPYLRNTIFPPFPFNNVRSNNASALP